MLVDGKSDSHLTVQVKCHGLHVPQYNPFNFILRITNIR